MLTAFHMLPLPLFLPSLGIGELGLVLVLVLLLFGPGKLPHVAQSLGEAVQRFRRGADPSDKTDQASALPQPSEPPPQGNSSKADEHQKQTP
jgi:sec-independent protein translocase protein TatA